MYVHIQSMQWVVMDGTECSGHPHTVSLRICVLIAPSKSLSGLDTASVITMAAKD